jgi:hypothetical protein
VQSILQEDPTPLERFASLVAVRQAELTHLSQEERHAHNNGLLSAMRRIFSALAGN